ncbi:MAG: hypothetical protein ACI4SR_07405 [Faecalibacillus sp.]
MLYISKGKIIIKHYQNVFTLNHRLFECMIDQQVVSIYGQKIEIHYFGTNEIILYGQFETVKFV